MYKVNAAQIPDDTARNGHPAPNHRTSRATRQHATGHIRAGRSATKVVPLFAPDQAEPISRRSLPRGGQPGYARIKRGIDLAVSGVALLATLPIQLTVCLALWIEGKSPALISQKRVGLHGKPFWKVSFGSADPTVRQRSHLCRLMDRCGLASLPQLINVFVGDMSLVGPRAAKAQAVAHYPAPAFACLSLRPGMTGTWNLPKAPHPNTRRALFADLAYVRALSLRLDLGILAATLLSRRSRTASGSYPKG